ncbi:MAG: HET domain-containing protein, partial [Cytophagaceae bacterium]
MNKPIFPLGVDDAGNMYRYFILGWDGPYTRLPPYSLHGRNVDDGLGQAIERMPPFDTNSTESLVTALAWIRNCDEKHDCMANVGAKLPRRLLDVRNDRVSLREHTEGERAKYACLSHCWGTSSMLRTTSINRHLFAQGIEWNLLPRTFQDAISFVRKLNISYLWIDSLCIIQDNDLDWQQQSAEMASIYQNAYITLAATASANASGECFTPVHLRSGRDRKPLAIMKLLDGSEYSLSTRPPLHHEGFPLLQRGWVYQERVLSPRVLHFVTEELVWECTSLLDCECGSEEITWSFHRPLKGQSVDWHGVVEDYTRLALTNPSDIFPALSGIAKMTAAHLQDKYVAGM